MQQCTIWLSVLVLRSGWRCAQDVLICGWGDSTFMVALLHSMDEELPKGSQVTVLNLRPKEEVLGALLRASCADMSPSELVCCSHASSRTFHDV